jgi:hypothetical protein
MRTSIWTAGLAAAALTTTILVTGGGPSSTTPPASASAGLTFFDDCERLAEWYRAAALDQVTAYGLGGGHYGSLVTAAGAEEATVRDAAPGAPTDAVANGATGTNLQEAGVDEPDIAKTDGSRTYAVAGRSLVVTDVTGPEPVELGRLELPARLRGAELLLVGDRVVLFSSGMGFWGGGARVTVDHIYPAGAATTVMAVVDVGDPASMRLRAERQVDGGMIAAREHDGTVRLVVGSQPALPLVYPGPRWDLPRPGRREVGVLTPREALAENRRIISEADAQAFLPQQRVDGSGREPLLDCSEVTHPDDASGLGTISVLTFQPATPGTLAATGVSASGEQVYASTDRLYVATFSGGWWSWQDGGKSSAHTTTDVHAFDVTGRGTTYVASGAVPGYAPDRWSFSEHEGLLRVAATEQKRWRDVQSTVTVLAENGNRLEPVGSVGGMGPGEQIQSVRWFGDLAIVVTFEQTDPLYTVDLSDPTRPTVIGELKIPGFSAYLHPLGDDLLLGVGQDATSSGETTGSQASSFDLSDLAEPRRITALDLGRHTYSSVEDDARAFTYLPEQRLALVPVASWRTPGRLKVVRVGEDGSLTVGGSLEVRDAYGLRALPLEDGRVAVIAGGRVSELVDPSRLRT